MDNNITGLSPILNQITLMLQLGVAVNNLAPNTITSNSIANGAITDAKFTVPTLLGPATGILGMITQLWRRFFKKTRHDKATNQILTYADNGSTVLTTQAITNTVTVDDVGAAT